MTKLYYDGDSYSLGLPQGQTKTTGHVIADRLGYELEHYGCQGKSPAQIIRSSVRYSLEDIPCFMAIGFGVISRLETFSDEVPVRAMQSSEYKNCSCKIEFKKISFSYNNNVCFISIKEKT